MLTTTDSARVNLERGGCRAIACRLIVLALLACSPDALRGADEAPAGGSFRVGFADRDVSPQIGDEAPGGYGKARHTAFHDPCKARAAVFDDGTGPVAIVGLDALLIRKPQVAEARRRITERTGIPGERVMIAASHTHEGGPTGMVLPGEFDGDSALVRELAYEKTVVGSPEYLEKVVEGIAAAVTAALPRPEQSLQEVTMEALPVLVGEIMNPSPLVRAAVIIAIGKYGPAASPAAPPLAGALEHDQVPEIRLQAALALMKTKMRSARAVALPALQECAKSPNPALAGPAQRVLAAEQPAAATATLETRVSHDFPTF